MIKLYVGLGVALILFIVSVSIWYASGKENIVPKGGTVVNSSFDNCTCEIK